jgi:hypothetical protein
MEETLDRLLLAAAVWKDISILNWWDQADLNSSQRECKWNARVIQ